MIIEVVKLLRVRKLIQTIMRTNPQCAFTAGTHTECADAARHSGYPGPGDRRVTCGIIQGDTLVQASHPDATPSILGQGLDIGQFHPFFLAHATKACELALIQTPQSEASFDQSHADISGGQGQEIVSPKRLTIRGRDDGGLIV